MNFRGTPTPQVVLWAELTASGTSKPGVSKLRMLYPESIMFISIVGNSSPNV